SSEILGHLLAFGEGFGVWDQNLISDISWNLPAVRGMGLANVHDIDVSLIFVIGIQFFDRTDRIAERRSGTTAENKHDRLALQRGKFHGGLAGHILDGEIAGGIAHTQIALPWPWPFIGGNGYRCGRK